MNCLIVVDYQVDFVIGSLGFKQAVQLEERISKKIEVYIKNQDQVIYTLDSHDEAYLSSQEGKKLPVKHCIKNTDGWVRYGKIADYPGLVIEKDRFGSTELFNYLQQNTFDQIEIVGLVTNICVLVNAVLVKTAAKETPVTVDAACTASYNQLLHEKALDIMEELQIHVVNRGKRNE